MIRRPAKPTKASLRQSAMGKHIDAALALAAAAQFGVVVEYPFKGDKKLHSWGCKTLTVRLDNTAHVVGTR